MSTRNHFDRTGIEAGFRVYRSVPRRSVHAPTFDRADAQTVEVYVKPVKARLSSEVEKLVQNLLQTLCVTEEVDFAEYWCSAIVEKNAIEVAREEKVKINSTKLEPTVLLRFDREPGSEYEAHFEIQPVLRGRKTCRLYVMPVLIGGSKILFLNAK